MKIGLLYSNVGLLGTPDGARLLAEAAEKHGIESLWTVEHVVVPQDYKSEYPYSRSGRMGGGEQAPIPDPLAWISYMAAITSSVRLATGILILPQRSPVILAKEIATIDILSGGRFILGVGIGWLAEEFAAIGVPFEERASRTDEAIQALRTLWSADETFAGQYFKFKDARSYPKPIQEHIPIVVGGHSKGAARRAGRLADGFFPAKGNYAELFEECRNAARQAGRDPDSIELTAGGAPTVDMAKQLQDMGVSRLVTAVPGLFNPAELDKSLGELQDNLISKVS